MRTWLGFDNGCTASWAVINEFAWMSKMPVFKGQSYTKKKQEVTRIDTHMLLLMLHSHQRQGRNNMFALVERPYVNPKGFKATLSAMRALESLLIVLESLEIPYQYIDSREWQKALLPSGLKGIELKHASRDIGIRLFPELKEDIIKHGDADGLLIAEHARRNNL